MLDDRGLSMTMPKRIYFSPWLDRETGETYGPETHATLAKHHARHRDWSFRVATPSKAARSVDAGELRAWMRLEDGTLRLDVPKAEADAYLLVCERGFSERTAAVKLNCSRRTVRVRLMRLRTKAGQP